MSISIVLIPLAIAIVASAKGSLSKKKVPQVLETAVQAPIETRFNDITLLNKTLQEYGLSTTLISADQLVCTSQGGTITYFRKGPNQPFFMDLSSIENKAGLIQEIDTIENEYNRNVQTYTYEKLMSKLEENNMSVAEETVLEDDSIFIKVNI